MNLFPKLYAVHQILDCLNDIVLRTADLCHGVPLSQRDGAICEGLKVDSDS